VVVAGLESIRGHIDDVVLQVTCGGSKVVGEGTGKGRRGRKNVHISSVQLKTLKVQRGREIVGVGGHCGFIFVIVSVGVIFHRHSLCFQPLITFKCKRVCVCVHADHRYTVTH